MIMANILFIETDKEDRRQISKKHPEAIILSGTAAEEDIVNKYPDTEILVCFIYSRLDKETLLKLPKLKLICTRSVGFDHIDLAFCRERGITVCNVPDYGSHVIAEHVFALLLGSLRHIYEADKRVEGGAFDYRGLRGIALKDKTIGIVGTGKIGRTVACIAHGFGMHILAFDVFRHIELEKNLGLKYTDMDELLKESDIVTLHAPANENTKHMINAEALEKMKEGIILVNTARGALIDSDALLQALKKGKVSYALLDVLEHEQNFEENKDLIAHPNVVSTPHIAFYADDSVRNMYEDCFRAIEDWQQGKKPEHVIRQDPVVKVS